MWGGARGGGYVPGYRDPLSMGGGGGGFGQPTMGMGAPGGGGFAQPGMGFSVGGALKDAAGYFTDKDQGLQRTNLLVQALGMGANVYGAHQAGKERDRERRMYEQEAERKRQREESLDPYRQQVLDSMMRRRAERG